VRTSGGKNDGRSLVFMSEGLSGLSHSCECLNGWTDGRQEKRKSRTVTKDFVERPVWIE